MIVHIIEHYFEETRAKQWSRIVIGKTILNKINMMKKLMSKYLINQTRIIIKNVRTDNVVRIIELNCFRHFT